MSIKSLSNDPYQQPAWKRYFQALLLVVSATGIGIGFIQLSLDAGLINVVAFYLLAVVLAALYLGRGPAVMVSIVSMLVFDYLFVPPSYTFEVADPQYLVTFASIMVVGLVISQLTARAHLQTQSARLRAVESNALYELANDLSNAVTEEAIQDISREKIRSFLGYDAILSIAGDHQTLQTDPLSQGDASWNAIQVQTCYAECRLIEVLDPEDGIPHKFLPLIAVNGCQGVLEVIFSNEGMLPQEETQYLLDTYAGQIAATIERLKLSQQAHQAKYLRETEKLQSALLNSISHDLRTPLVSITGALSQLRDDPTVLGDENRTSLVETAYEEAEHLNRLVGNLLEITRIEAGAIHLNRAPCDVTDVIGSALEQLGSRIEGHPLNIQIPGDIGLVDMDFVLIVHALVNLLDNANKYSPPGTPIDIEVRQTAEETEIEVRDRGGGIPEADLPHIFDKFYRVQRQDHVSGTGLGLPIIQGIIEAHGGQVTAMNRPGGGMIFTMILYYDGWPIG